MSSPVHFCFIHLVPVRHGHTNTLTGTQSNSTTPISRRQTTNPYFLLWVQVYFAPCQCNFVATLDFGCCAVFKPSAGPCACTNPLRSHRQWQFWRSSHRCRRRRRHWPCQRWQSRVLGRVVVRLWVVVVIIVGYGSDRPSCWRCSSMRCCRRCRRQVSPVREPSYSCGPACSVGNR